MAARNRSPAVERPAAAGPPKGSEGGVPLTMWETVFRLPDQLRWAAGVDPPEMPAADRALVAGMGGSGISGDFAALVGEEGGRLVAVHKGYDLPGWAATERPLVVAVSYSGNTEETVSAAEAAREGDLPAAVVAGDGRLGELADRQGWVRIAVPGGLQPRAALGYLVGALLRVLEGAGLVPAQGKALERTAGLLEELLGTPDRPGPAVGLAEDLAEGLAGRIPVIYGGIGPGAVAAQRWKTQVNENAKTPAAWGVLPELDHNEVVGWSGPLGLTRTAVGVILLRDPGDHDRVALRFDLTAGLVAEGAPVIGEVWAQGEAPLERAFSLAVIGDLVSVRLAEQAGVDPLAVEPIERLKEQLSAAGPEPPADR